MSKRDLIHCPRCGHVCGNTVDRARRVTLHCQYCLYTGSQVTDGRALMNPLDTLSIGQDTMTERPELHALREALERYDANDSETSYYDAKEVCNAARQWLVAVDREYVKENAISHRRETDAE